MNKEGTPNEFAAQRNYALFTQAGRIAHPQQKMRSEWMEHDAWARKQAVHGVVTVLIRTRWRRTWPRRVARPEAARALQVEARESTWLGRGRAKTNTGEDEIGPVCCNANEQRNLPNDDGHGRQHRTLLQYTQSIAGSLTKKMTGN